MLKLTRNSLTEVIHPKLNRVVSSYLKSAKFAVNHQPTTMDQKAQCSHIRNELCLNANDRRQAAHLLPSVHNTIKTSRMTLIRPVCQIYHLSWTWISLLGENEVERSVKLHAIVTSYHSCINQWLYRIERAPRSAEKLAIVLLKPRDQLHPSEKESLSLNVQPYKSRNPTYHRACCANLARIRIEIMIQKSWERLRRNDLPRARPSTC